MCAPLHQIWKKRGGMKAVLACSNGRKPHIDFCEEIGREKNRGRQALTGKKKAIMKTVPDHRKKNSEPYKKGEKIRFVRWKKKKASLQRRSGAGDCSPRLGPKGGNRPDITEKGKRRTPFC